MAESKRLRVLEALTKQLQTIDGYNGYDYDVSCSVVRGVAKFGEDAPMPMLSILEAPRPEISSFAGDYNVRTEDWVLLLQGWDNVEDPINPTDKLYRFMADVELCLGQVMAERGDGSGRPACPEVYRLGGMVKDMKFGPGVVRPANEGVSAKACFYLVVRIGLADDVG